MRGEWMDRMDDDGPVGAQIPKKPSFFACYLLCSLSPRYKGITYIGFTVNPRRRIRQHNGEIKSGAWQTKKKRPWEMIMCIYGFPSQVSALKFEWAWQHPKKSLAVREAAKGLKPLRGAAGKIKLAYTMLTLPEWRSLNLTVNFLSTKYINNTKGCPPLPSHMKVHICPVDELPCYTDIWASDDEDDLAEERFSSKSDASDPEEGADGIKVLSFQKNSNEIRREGEHENDFQPIKKCGRRRLAFKQKSHSFTTDELGSEAFPSPTREQSLFSGQEDAQVTSKEQDKLDTLFARSDTLLQISDSEDIEDNYSPEEHSAYFQTSDSSLIQCSSVSVSLRQHALYKKDNNLLDGFSIECSVGKDSEADKMKDIVNEPGISCGVTPGTNPAEFPSFQEYSPLCYTSPLKTSSEVLYSFISPCKSTPTGNLISCSFLSPVVSPCPIITISSTPRPVTRGVIDLTDSPVI